MVAELRANAAIAIMLSFRPAASVPQPPLLADQESAGKLTDRHVMVPPMSRSRLEMIQARLALGLLEYRQGGADWPGARAHSTRSTATGPGGA